MNPKTWSEQDEEQLKFLYIEDGLKDVDYLAKIFEKGRRSVISKLVQLKIYEKPIKTKRTTRTVKMMVKDLEKILEITIDGTNLSKKENLTKLVEAIENKLS